MLCGVALVLSLVLQINVESSYFKNTAHVPVLHSAVLHSSVFLKLQLCGKRPFQLWVIFLRCNLLSSPRERPLFLLSLFAFLFLLLVLILICFIFLVRVTKKEKKQQQKKTDYSLKAKNFTPESPLFKQAVRSRRRQTQIAAVCVDVCDNICTVSSYKADSCAQRADCSPPLCWKSKSHRESS